MINLIILGYILHVINAPTIIWIAYGISWVWTIIKEFLGLISVLTK